MGTKIVDFDILVDDAFVNICTDPSVTPLLLVKDVAPVMYNPVHPLRGR